MSIYDKMTAEKGTVCKWLESDDYCHMTKCILKSAKRNELSERFRQLGLKGDYSIEIFPYGCEYLDKDCSKCFIPRNNEEENIIIEDSEGYDMTKFELEAQNIAKECFKEKEKVKNLYKEGQNIYIKMLRNKIEALENEVNTLENENKNF